MTDVYIEPLTEGESEVLALLAEELSNKEIANRLYKSVRTIEDYVRRLNSKLDTANRHEIVQRAQTLGLLDADKPRLAPLKTNLPHATTLFIGRDVELDAIHDLLANPNTRLLTILAPGGMGKTRLALEAAEQQLSNFKSGVYFVPLQPLSDAAHLLTQIAASTGYQFASDDREPKQQVLDFLSNKHMLLLLDNFEHLLDGAPLLGDILGAAPDVNLLVTSREKLNLSMETVYGLGGMTFPAWENTADALQYDAVQLLVSAAGRAKPGWQVTAENLDDVARVCQLTQGMPLGILLAASWLDVFSLERICEEIQQSADILETELRDVPERQRSIRAVFDAAWAGLQSTEQRVFMQMSVFRGGCSPRAAEQVTGANPRILQALVNKALLLRNREGRYDIHELLRQYAEEQLMQSGEAESARNAHMNYYAAELHEREAHLKDHRQLAALRDIGGDFENTRAAWRWAVNQGHDEQIGRMVATIGLFAWIGGRFHDGLDLLEEALEHSSQQPRWVARVLMFQGCLLTVARKLEGARIVLETNLGALRESGNSGDVVLCSRWLGTTLYHLGEFAQALAVTQESLSLAATTRDTWLLAEAHLGFGYSCIGAKKMNDADSHFQRSLELYSEISNPFGMAWAYYFGGYVSAALGRTEEFYQKTLKAYHLFSKIENKFGMAQVLVNLGAHSRGNGDWQLAEQHRREALMLHRDIGLAPQIVYSLSLLIEVLLNIGNFDEAKYLSRDAIAMSDKLSKNYEGVAPLDISLSLIAGLNGDYEEAHRLAQEAYTIAQMKANMFLTAQANQILGLALCGIGRFEAAIEHLIVSLKVDLSMGNFPDFLRCVAAFAQIEAHHGKSERATELLGLVFEHPIQIAWLGQHGRVVELREHLKAELGDDDYLAAWERGKSLDLKVVVQELLDTFSKEA